MDEVDLNSPSVQSYLSILQGVINRMAANSAACKTWCVALVSAIVVIIADKGRPEFIWISILPITLLFFLDSYYLGLERHFRNIYNSFIKKIHTNQATVDDVFIIISPGRGKDKLGKTLCACFSFSIWPFYGLLALMLVVVQHWVLLISNSWVD